MPYQLIGTRPHTRNKKVVQNGVVGFEAQVFEVGDLIEPTAAELRDFPDKFRLHSSGAERDASTAAESLLGLQLKAAKPLIAEESSLETLIAWQEAEALNQDRKGVNAAIVDRLAELQGV